MMLKPTPAMASPSDAPAAPAAPGTRWRAPKTSQTIGADEPGEDRRRLDVHGWEIARGAPAVLQVLLDPRLEILMERVPPPELRLRRLRQLPTRSHAIPRRHHWSWGSAREDSLLAVRSSAPQSYVTHEAGHHTALGCPQGGLMGAITLLRGAGEQTSDGGLAVNALEVADLSVGLPEC